MKAIEQFYPVLAFMSICQGVPYFASVDEIHLPLLSCGIQDALLAFESMDKNLKVQNFPLILQMFVTLNPVRQL